MVHAAFMYLLLACSFFGVVLSQDQQIQCAKGLQVFISRGTNETLGPGVSGALGEILRERIPDTQVHPVPYPASFLNPDYFTSVLNGTLLLREMITRYTKVCPESKIALLGYSQGAQITSNNLCGTPPVWLAGNPSLAPLPKSIIENHIVAVVLFGDPTFRSDDSFARGTAQGSGMFFRGNHKACNAVGDHIASYCDAGDPICDVESEVTETNMHVTYLERYLEESAEWVVERFSKGSSESPSPGGNNATTSAVVVPSTLPTEQSNAAREVTSLLTVYIPALMVAVVMS